MIIRSTPEIQQYLKLQYNLDIDESGVLQEGGDPNNVLDIREKAERHPDIRKISALLGELQRRANERRPKAEDTLESK